MLTVSLLLCAMIALARADDAAAAPAGCPNGFEEFKGRCFHYNSDIEDWADAEKHCQSLKSNLASVHNDEEYQFIQGMITAKTSGFPEAWIGGTDCQQEGTWLWSDGKAFSHAGWCAGAPDNEGGNQCCVEMNFGPGKCWNDMDCSAKLPSVCATNM